jgi:regulator of protease activity HflC (stomatin/prohibitin superfamily)
VAEGQKQSAILKAEGDKQSQILSAEGERQAAVLRAQGFADALQAIFNTAQNVDANTMTLQYLEALKDVGTSASTKFVLPLELTKMLGNIGNFTSGSAESNGR